VIGFFLDEFEVALQTLESFAEMNNFDVSIEMVFVPKTHDALFTFVIFNIGV
jgi:hypothetical protein